MLSGNNQQPSLAQRQPHRKARAAGIHLGPPAIEVPVLVVDEQRLAFRANTHQNMRGHSFAQRQPHREPRATRPAHATARPSAK